MVRPSFHHQSIRLGRALLRLGRLAAPLSLAFVLFAFAGRTARVGADDYTYILNPVRITVPAIGVDAKVQDVGLADDGSMGVPVGYDDVAYYTLSVTPGVPGYSAFTGHISSIYFPGVFYNIDELSKGNTIHVFGDDGAELVFTVTDVHRYPADNFPLDKIFSSSIGTPGVALITCGGDWDPVAHLFADRIVVLASLSTGS
jgi:sortase family protein